MLSRPPVPQRGRTRILVVDDEPANRRLLNRILSAKAEIIEADSGQQALELLAAEDFDIVLLDIMMPGMNGLEALSILRELPKTADLPVILISAMSQSDDIVRGLQMRANDYITKPIDIDVVMARVDTQIKLKASFDLQKRAVAELEAAQKMKDRLFSIASHDLRGPLANMRLIQSLLRDYVMDQPEALEILDMLHSTVDKMKSIVEDFLDMAAYQGGNIAVNLRRTDIGSVVKGVIAQYSVTAYDKNIALVSGDLSGSVHTDPARMEQVLNNLVSNAIKYSPRDSTVSVWVEHYDDRVRIFIADQGEGIPENERDRLFKEFSKLSTRPTANEASSGLGLWIVKQIVTLLQGDVGVDSPPGGGSIFWIDLPAAQI